jgi:hypothetical protein
MGREARANRGEIILGKFINKAECGLGKNCDRKKL